MRPKEYRVRFDAAGKVLGGSWDASLGERLGIALDEARDKDIMGYLGRLASLAADLPERLRRRVERLLSDQEEFLVHGDFGTDGGAHHLHISGRAIRNYTGELVFTLLFLDDTEHTQLRRLYEYMFRLANHELKSPLACILGATEFAEEHVAAESLAGVKTCLDMIHRNAVVMEEMIQRYLTLSRIESGHVTLEPDDVVFSADVLNPITRELRPALLAKGMDVAFEAAGPSREPVIVADREALAVVIRNLLSNAIKYGTPKTVVRVVLRMSKDGPEIGVENEGDNIPETQLKRLFQKFVRLEATQGAKGAGLGLYNARRMVEFWGGTIRAESAEGRTAFIFTIPQD
ncbi:MAG: HAMP domain-containing histidine kinase [Candidatus Hydrogenedentes bacterium]|nr:HAMP domain-containing histidine kinase [Candidatus Hydrogenedentota bacterium]